MQRPYSERWILALGLMTAAATCLSPSDECAADAETDPLERADATQPSGLESLLRHATTPAQLEEDVEPRRRGPAPAATPPTRIDDVVRPNEVADVATGSWRTPRPVGTPLYLVAPKQSPPSAAPPALS